MKTDINIEELIIEDIAGRQNAVTRERSLREYYRNPNYCLHCDSLIIVAKHATVSDTRAKKYCSLRCATSHRYANTPKSIRLCSVCGGRISPDNSSGLCASCYKQKRDNDIIQKWRETGSTGCGVSSTIRNCIRSYIFEKQNGECAICHMEARWNSMELHFILDHFDGDASNNDEDNLRLICPNCDSQLDTYKSRNKNSARAHRRTE